MIIVKHRQNKISQIKNLDNIYGAEIDIHAYKNSLIIHHDPFNEGVNFERWIKYFNHKFLIANIKEEGIENKVISILKKNNIKNYFLLDVTIPMIIKLNNFRIYNIALRVSRYENVLNINNFNKKNKWIWVDTFNNILPIRYENILKLKNNNFKFCLVSPELISNKKKDISLLYKKNIKLIKEMNMVCTKFPNCWESLI